MLDENKCEECRYYENDTSDTGGFCLRHAPTTRLIVTTDQYKTFWGHWPRVNNNSSCGDFEPMNP